MSIVVLSDGSDGSDESDGAKSYRSGQAGRTIPSRELWIPTGIHAS